MKNNIVDAVPAFPVTGRFESATGMNNPKIFPILSDHLGTARKILDGDSGEVRWSWDAKQPFGHELPNENPTAGLSSFVFDLRFPGQRYDEETGLFQNGFRDYHPGLGRYVQSDPIGLDGGWNTYLYVAGNPVGRSDSSGLVIDGAAFNVPEFRIALHQLSSSPKAREVIQKVVDSKRILKIKLNNQGFANYNKRENVINWDPSLQLQCSMTMEKLSSETILIHEMIHFLQQEAGFNINGNGLDFNDPAVKNRWDNIREYDAINNYENKIAIEKGELVRKSHRLFINFEGQAVVKIKNK